MKRFVAGALIAVLATASSAFAGDSILTSGTRQVQQIAAADMRASAQSGTNPVATAPAAAYQEGGPGNLSKSGHSKMTKTMIYVALGVGFGLAAWQIDRHVLNITPSSLGQRKD